MVHTAGYMVQTAYTFKMFFNYEENDVSGAPLI
jgi:acyl-coenzyme A synthetase/AMP-(fatty) acid ligase